MGCSCCGRAWNLGEKSCALAKREWSSNGPNSGPECKVDTWAFPHRQGSPVASTQSQGRGRTGFFLETLWSVVVVVREADQAGSGKVRLLGEGVEGSRESGERRTQESCSLKDGLEAQVRGYKVGS